MVLITVPVGRIRTSTGLTNKSHIDTTIPTKNAVKYMLLFSSHEFITICTLQSLDGRRLHSMAFVNVQTK